MAIPRPLNGLLYSGGKLIRPDHRAATELRPLEIIPELYFQRGRLGADSPG